MKPSDLSNLVQRYSAGESLGQIGREIGVKGETVGRWLSSSGISLRTKSEAITLAKLKKVPDDFVSRYLAGESLNVLGKEYGISRGGISRSGRNAGRTFGLLKRLLDCGISPRTRTSSERIKWSRMSDETRGAQVQQAHLHNFSKDESVFIREMNRRGICLDHQFVIGKYNVDFAISKLPIAVEIQRVWTINKGQLATHYEDRLKYILNRGYCVFYICGKITNIDRICQNVIAFRDFVCSDKPEPCGYRMITGDGNFCATSCSYLGKLPVI